jgi:EAL domain-containing protein (putative c-di-GMP-specific phosphodiesterase class I)
MVQLVHLPFSEVKIDKSFVIDAARSEESRRLFRSVVDLGHSLKLKATGEGVKDMQTLAFLKSIGCDLAQGYFIALPMPGDSVAKSVDLLNEDQRE